MTGEEWHQVVDIGLNGFFNVTQPLLKNMLSKRFGRIINIVSLSGIKGLPGQTNYSACQGWYYCRNKSFSTRSSQKESYSQCYCTGFIRSDMTSDLNEEELKKLIPTGRFGTPEEVAELAWISCLSGGIIYHGRNYFY